MHKDPPAAPSGVMTTVDQSQFTPSTASITLTWSASSGADNYTIMVTPLLPSGQSLVSTTTTSLQLTVLYNEEYSINITVQNCVGSNSTIVPLTIIGNSHYVIDQLWRCHNHIIFLQLAAALSLHLLMVVSVNTAVELLEPC